MKIYFTPLHCSIKRIITASLMLISTTMGVQAQNIETSILEQFDGYRKNNLHEKMFVHSDKDFYVAGEICWFKIYAVDAFFHTPLDISKVAYAELLDNTNKPVVQAKIAMEKGGGNGSLYVPVTINSGNYKLRVYSNWMKNFSPDYFFEKTIRIINTRQLTALPAKLPMPAYDIQFFPEGGNLVNNIESKIACRIVDQNGKGINCNAVLVNGRKDTVLTFETKKFGMGNFNVMPTAGQQYTAIIAMPNGKVVSKELPLAFDNGYVMRLTVDGEKQVKIIVHSVADKSGQAASTVYLFAHTRGSVKAALSAPILNGVATFLIKHDQLGDGITHFTIFNGDRRPVCERLYFKNPTEKGLVNIAMDQAAYNTRQKIHIRIAATNEHTTPVAAGMSMAVYRVDSLQLPAESGISEYLWLTSDLPGNVENPEYYFNTSGSATAEAMDNLMLTNGWRRFKWEEVLQNKKPFFKFAPEYNGHLVTGKIVNNKTGATVPNINAFFSAPGTTRFRTALSDEAGNVKFEIQNFYGSSGIVVQTNTETDTAYHVEIDNPFCNAYSKKLLPAFAMPGQNAATLLDQSISMQVENIYHGDIRKKVKEGMIDTSNFYEHPNEIYQLDNYTRFTTMEEVLREYILSVGVRKKRSKFHLPVFNDDIVDGPFETDPLLLLDGVPVFNMDKIVQYDPLKVSKLQAVTRRYFYGQLSFDGIVNFVTYNGNLDGFELDPHATIIDYEALQLQREFYSPLYETTQQVNSHLPDFRNVLNWVPEINTGKDGKYETSFYSSDLPGKYVVTVQALTKDGKPGSCSIFFEVKNTPK